MKTLWFPLRQSTGATNALQRVHYGSQESGLTLIECLVAIVMVALIGAIIAPAMVLSVATRVQSQRASQALDLAQSEIDKIRVLIERGDDYVAELPPTIPVGTLDDERELALVDGPDSLVALDERTVYTEAFPIDIDDDGDDDFAIQSFRTPGKQDSASNPVAFVMGVRVYDSDTVDNADSNLPTELASLSMTSGEGERTDRPLATLYSSIALSEDGKAFCNYIDYLSSATVSPPSGCE
jgi:type II secretory pathway pseudopilin PulG